VNAVERAAEIVDTLIAAGVRASTDPQTVAVPAVLVPPPRREFNIGCGYTAHWELPALAPAPIGANHTTWADLDRLVTVAADVLPVEEAPLVTVNLAGTDYPAYLLRWSEALA